MKTLEILSDIGEKNGLTLEEELQVLQRLGLTRLQSNVYIMLVMLKASTAKNLSKSAQVPRQDIYRILDELHEIGLIEKEIASPTVFRAIPITEGTSTLMEHRNEETVELQKDIRRIIFRLNKKAKNIIPQEDSCFILIPKREALIRNIKKTIENAQESIDIITSGSIMAQVLFRLEESFNKALKKGIKIRYITGKLENATWLLKSLSALKKNPSFQMRFLSNPPTARFGIYDKRELFIATHPSSDAFKTNALWSNNPSLVEAITDYFENKWLIATESNHQISRKPKN
jgi:sugar-specific transcriptional regulator TrmB